MQCAVASRSQQKVFDKFTRILANEEHMITTKDLFESGKLKWGDRGVPAEITPLMNVYSAFSPMDMPDGAQSVDVYNNWLPDHGHIFDDDHVLDDMVEQSWIQTADQAIVCTSGNAIFDVWYEFVETALPLIRYNISEFDRIRNPQGGADIPAYIPVYQAFSSLLNGNVSTTLMKYPDPGARSVGQINYTFDGNVTIYDSSSRVLQHGLSACDDFKLGYVSSLP